MTVAALHSPYVRDFAGFDRPWRLLEEHVDELAVTELAFGTGFEAIGRARGTRSAVCWSEILKAGQIFATPGCCGHRHHLLTRA